MVVRYPLFSFCLVGELLCLCELALKVTHTTLGLSLHPSDARGRLSLRPLDPSVSVGLQFGDDGFDLRPQPLDEPCSCSISRPCSRYWVASAMPALSRVSRRPSRGHAQRRSLPHPRNDVTNVRPQSPLPGSIILVRGFLFFGWMVAFLCSMAVIGLIPTVPIFR
jgi:hypothetical protein